MITYDIVIYKNIVITKKLRTFLFKVILDTLYSTRLSETSPEVTTLLNIFCFIQGVPKKVL